VCHDVAALRIVPALLIYLRTMEAGLKEFLTALATFASDRFDHFRRWLTFRRVLGIVAFLILLVCLRDLMAVGADISFLFGLDLGLVVEVSALMIILSVRDHVVTAAYLVRRRLLRLNFKTRLLRRGVRRAFRSRPETPLLPPPPDDEPAAWAFAVAC
jgi:hypothetical protein